MNLPRMSPMVPPPMGGMGAPPMGAMAAAQMGKQPMGMGRMPGKMLPQMSSATMKEIKSELF